ncbi:42205_t:CDS:2, partial [Gigaspora margarita]
TGASRGEPRLTQQTKIIQSRHPVGCSKRQPQRECNASSHHLYNHLVDHGYILADFGIGIPIPIKIIKLFEPFNEP